MAFKNWPQSKYCRNQNNMSLIINWKKTENRVFTETSLHDRNGQRTDKTKLKWRCRRCDSVAFLIYHWHNFTNQWMQPTYNNFTTATTGGNELTVNQQLNVLNVLTTADNTQTVSETRVLRQSHALQLITNFCIFWQTNYNMWSD